MTNKNKKTIKDFMKFIKKESVAVKNTNATKDFMKNEPLAMKDIHAIKGGNGGHSIDISYYDAW